MAVILCQYVSGRCHYYLDTYRWRQQAASLCVVAVRRKEWGVMLRIWYEQFSSISAIHVANYVTLIPTGDFRRGFCGLVQGLACQKLLYVLFITCICDVSEFHMCGPLHHNTLKKRETLITVDHLPRQTLTLSDPQCLVPVRSRSRKEWGFICKRRRRIRYVYSVTIILLFLHTLSQGEHGFMENT